MRTNNFTYNLQKRETKTKGTVYDVYFYITDVDGKRKQKALRGFKTKADATRAFSAYMEQSLTAPKVDRNAKYLMYEDARNRYLNAVAPTVKESSLYDFKHTGSKYADVFFKRKNLHALTKQDVLDFQDWLYAKKKKDGKPYSPITVLKIYRQFKTFYSWCVQRYDVPDVVSAVPFAVRRVQKRQYTVWTQDDFNRFIAVVDNDKYRALFTTLFYSGMRIGEAQALKVADYDGSALFVHATYVKKTLDGSAYKITETKNYKARRVPLPAPCRAVLDEFVKNRSADEFLFGGGSPTSLTAIRNYFDIRISRAGVPRIRIHDLRHSYVSLLLSKEVGASFPVVASLIGDTLEQVVKTYAHEREDDKIAVVSAIL